MYLLKLKKISKDLCIFSTYFVSFRKLNLLGEFVEDFGFPHPGVKRVVEDFFQNPNDQLLISYQFADDVEEYFEIPKESLKKLMNLYWDARAKCPQEIIIKFDENMENPLVETVL